jgi:hypothetical protein
VELQIDSTRAPSPVAGRRRCRSPSSPPSGSPPSALVANGSDTAARGLLANGSGSKTTPPRPLGTIAARRGAPPLRLFSRDAGDVVIELALQAPPPLPPTSPPVSPTLRNMWINVQYGPPAPTSLSLAHVVVRLCENGRGSLSTSARGGHGGGHGGCQAYKTAGASGRGDRHDHRRIRRIFINKINLPE